MSMSPAARFRYTLVAGATAVVIGSGFTVVGLSRHAGAHAQSPTAADVPLAAIGTSAAPQTDPPHRFAVSRIDGNGERRTRALDRRLMI